MPTISLRASDGATGYTDGTFYSQGTNQYIACSTTKQMFSNYVFPALNIPQGATIDSATLTLTARDNQDWSNAPSSLLIGAEQVDNAIALQSGDYTTRYDDVGVQTNWNPGTWGTINSGQLIEGSDVTVLVQQIVDRGGWSSGNNIGFTMLGPTTSGCYTCHSPSVTTDSNRPLLEVTYTDDTTPPTVLLSDIHGSDVLDNVYLSSGYASSDNILTVSGSASDSGSGLSLVEVRVDGGSWQSATGTASWSINLDVGTFTSGNFLIEARSKDAADNLSIIASDEVWYAEDGSWAASSTDLSHFIPIDFSGFNPSG